MNGRTDAWKVESCKRALCLLAQSAQMGSRQIEEVLTRVIERNQQNANGTQTSGSSGDHGGYGDYGGKGKGKWNADEWGSWGSDGYGYGKSGRGGGAYGHYGHYDHYGSWDGTDGKGNKGGGSWEARDGKGSGSWDAPLMQPDWWAEAVKEARRQDRQDAASASAHANLSIARKLPSFSSDPN